MPKRKADFTGIDLADGVQVVDDCSMLVRVSPAQLIQRVLVVNRTQGSRYQINVHVQPDGQGTLLVRVSHG